MKKLKLLLLVAVLAINFSCTKDESTEQKDPIVGKWFLKKVNTNDVSNINCYKDSYIDSDGNKISFFIQDRQENGSCKTVLNTSKDLKIKDKFYYIGDEAIEIYIKGNELTWRLNINTTLIFSK